MANPWTFAGQRRAAPASGFGCGAVREGPVVFQRHGKIFLTLLCLDTRKPDYKLGMLDRRRQCAT